MSFHYATVNYQIPLHFRLKRGEPPLKTKATLVFNKMYVLYRVALRTVLSLTLNYYTSFICHTFSTVLIENRI